MGLYFGGGAYIWNEVSVSTCGGLIYTGGLYSGGGAYSRRFAVFIKNVLMLSCRTSFDIKLNLYITAIFRSLPLMLPSPHCCLLLTTEITNLDIIKPNVVNNLKYLTVYYLVSLLC